MFFFWRNRDKPLEPAFEAVATWNQLTRIQGLGSKPTLSDILLVFNRYAKRPFLGEPQRLIFETGPDFIRLKRCFGDRGCLLIRLSLPVRTTEIIDFPLTERTAFIRAVRANPTYRDIKNVPLEALCIVYDSQP